MLHSTSSHAFEGLDLEDPPVSSACSVQLHESQVVQLHEVGEPLLGNHAGNGNHVQFSNLGSDLDNPHADAWEEEPEELMYPGV